MEWALLLMLSSVATRTRQLCNSHLSQLILLTLPWHLQFHCIARWALAGKHLQLALVAASSTLCKPGWKFDCVHCDGKATEHRCGEHRQQLVG
jgi:hypothetical protein